MPRKLIAAVVGSGRPSAECSGAYEVGRELAGAGYVVLTGGGEGVMEAVSKGASDAGGLVMAMLPSDGPDDPRYSGHFPNAYVDIAVYTGLSDARNSVIARTADIMIAFPGGAGTMSEVCLGLKSGKHVIAVGWPYLPAPSDESSVLVIHVQTATDAIAAARKLLGDPNA